MLPILVVHNHVKNEARFVELEKQVERCNAVEATRETFSSDSVLPTAGFQNMYEVFRRSVSGFENVNDTESFATEMPSLQEGERNASDIESFPTVTTSTEDTTSSSKPQNYSEDTENVATEMPSMRKDERNSSEIESFPTDTPSTEDTTSSSKPQNYSEDTESVATEMPSMQKGEINFSGIEGFPTGTPSMETSEPQNISKDIDHTKSFPTDTPSSSWKPENLIPTSEEMPTKSHNETRSFEVHQKNYLNRNNTMLNESLVDVTSEERKMTAEGSFKGNASSNESAVKTNRSNVTRENAVDQWSCLELLKAIITDNPGNSSVCKYLRGPPGEGGPQGTPGGRGPQGMMGPRGEKGGTGYASGHKDNESEKDEIGCSGTMLAPPLFLETPRVYISSEGVASELTCNTTANPSADVTWYKDDVMLTGERYEAVQHLIVSQVPRRIQMLCPSKVPHPVTQSTLVIKRSRGSDTGTYVCRARNMMGVRYNKMDLTVRVPVAFTAVPSNISVLQDNTVRLNCGASGIPDAVITWYREDGEPMPVNHLVAMGDLIINNITKDQEGTFVCVAANVLGPKSTEATLTVNIFPKVTSFREQPLTSNEHRTVALPCNATGYPTPIISWRKLYGILAENRSTFDSQVLVIRNVEYEDRGEYVCTASNVAGTTERTVTLIVQVAPRILQRPKDTEFGYRSTRKVLGLEVFGFPPPNTTWSGPALRHVIGRSYQSNSSLVIMRTEYRDSGLYQATVRNVVGEVRLQTFLVVMTGVPPAFIVKPAQPKMDLEIGQNLSLTCSAVGTPTPIMVWYFNGSVLTTGVTGSKNRKTLSIVHVKFSHAGRYMCQATNDFGSVREYTVVDVTSRGLEASYILRHHGNNSYFRALNDFLDHVLMNRKTSRWTRCYRAPEDGWSSYTFHSRCDGRGPSVTIVRVGEYVFGGYTDQSWQRRGGYVGSYSSRKSFLYSLYNRHGVNPIKLLLRDNAYSYAIYRSSSYGPTFGSGHDLYIANNAGSNRNSKTTVTSYKPPPGCSFYYSGSSGNQCSFFAGSYKFTPNDVEVFYETTNGR